MTAGFPGSLKDVAAGGYQRDDKLGHFRVYLILLAWRHWWPTTRRLRYVESHIGLTRRFALYSTPCHFDRLDMLAADADDLCDDSSPRGIALAIGGLEPRIDASRIALRLASIVPAAGGDADFEALDMIIRREHHRHDSLVARRRCHRYRHRARLRLEPAGFGAPPAGSLRC